MRVAYLDCFSGVAGDMFLGALLHAGLSLEALEAELAKLGLDEFELKVERTWRDAMEGIRVEVVTADGAKPPHRGLSEIKTILVGSGLDPETKEWATAVFTRLAEAEAQVHGTTVDEIHFHEVGATDAIVDIVGVVAGLRLLGVEEVHASKIVLGRGVARCEHGEMPVPVPATLELLKDAPVVLSDLEGELVTPTGAALVSTLARSIGSGFSFVPTAIGYGFGTRVREVGPPNALR
ncbi:MAG: LarC family nickel insertion protein, partial [Planctomycetota bacterium JB042]